MRTWWARVWRRLFRSPPRVAAVRPVERRTWSRQSSLPGMPAVDLLDLLEAG